MEKLNNYFKLTFPNVDMEITTECIRDSKEILFFYYGRIGEYDLKIVFKKSNAFVKNGIVYSLIENDDVINSTDEESNETVPKEDFIQILKSSIEDFGQELFLTQISNILKEVNILLENGFTVGFAIGSYGNLKSKLIGY